MEACAVELIRHANDWFRRECDVSSRGENGSNCPEAAVQELVIEGQPCGYAILTTS
jgi:hypothetical protein